MDGKTTMDSKTTMDNNINKYLAKPELFTGGNLNPLTWLKMMDRLRVGVSMGDPEAILVAASHFRGKALRWWDYQEDSITTWVQFTSAFKKQFLPSDLVDRWWDDLFNYRQHGSQSVEDAAFGLKELFSRLKVTNEAEKVRYFMRCILPELAYEIEQNGVDDDFDAMVAKAKKIERLKSKYNISSYSTGGSIHSGNSGVSSEISHAMSRLADNFEALQINLAKTGAIPPPDEPSGNKSTPNVKKVVQCWKCKETGHYATSCPGKPSNEGKGSVGNEGNDGKVDSNNGSSGKDRERQ
jgi:hypothetical protein